MVPTGGTHRVAQGLPDGADPDPRWGRRGARRGANGAVRPTASEFPEAWPRVVRALASWTGSLDAAEEYAAEAFARAVAQEGPVDELAAWCVSVAKRAWIDDHRRRGVLDRIAPDLARRRTGRTTWTRWTPPTGHRRARRPGRAAVRRLRRRALPPGLADGARPAGGVRAEVPEVAQHLGIQEPTAAARLTRAKRALAQARGRVPRPRRRRAPRPAPGRAGLRGRHVHRRPPHRVRPAGRARRHRRARRCRSPTPSSRCTPTTTEVRGLRAVIRLGLARRPGRVDDDGVALTLDEVDRTRWDRRLCAPATADATARRRGPAGPVRPRGGDLRPAQPRPVVRGDRLAADRAALHRARADVARPRR